MNTKKIIVFAAIALALLLIVPAVPAQAQCCGNPLLFPLAVLGAAVGTAAAIASAPFYPYYGPAYGPVYPPPPPRAYYYHPAPAYYYRPAPAYYPRAWVPGRYAPYGGWIPGHWMYR